LKVPPPPHDATYQRFIKLEIILTQEVSEYIGFSTSWFPIDAQTTSCLYGVPYITSHLGTTNDGIKIWDSSNTRIPIHMDNMVNEVLDMFFENEKIKKYTYPILYVVISFNLVILFLLCILVYYVIWISKRVSWKLRSDS